MDELLALNQLRLDRDLSYQELATEIGGIDASVLYRVLNRRSRKPHDRTLHKIRRYLQRFPPTQRLSRGRRKRASAA